MSTQINLPSGQTFYTRPGFFTMNTQPKAISGYEFHDAGAINYSIAGYDKVLVKNLMSKGDEIRFDASIQVQLKSVIEPDAMSTPGEFDEMFGESDGVINDAIKIKDGATFGRHAATKLNLDPDKVDEEIGNALYDEMVMIDLFGKSSIGDWLTKNGPIMHTLIQGTFYARCDNGNQAKAELAKTGSTQLNEVWGAGEDLTAKVISTDHLITSFPVIDPQTVLNSFAKTESFAIAAKELGADQQELAKALQADVNDFAQIEIVADPNAINKNLIRFAKVELDNDVSDFMDYNLRGNLLAPITFTAADK